MLRIGLTGGIGSGKSTVASLFARHGAPVVDTDELARELVRPGMPAHQDIVAAFGPSILDPNGNLDREKMRARVFADAAERLRLERILHPRIREETVRRLNEITAPYTLVAVPLLIESGFDNIVDRILVVDCDEQTQIDRTMKRSGLSATDVRDVIVAQASRHERLARADDIVDNSNGMAELEKQVEQLHRRYLELAHG